MADKNKVPEKLDLSEILGGDDPGDGDQVEVLDPETGAPAEIPEGGDDRPEAGAEETGVLQALAEAREEKERLENLYIRTRADFENHRRRTERDREEETARAVGAIVREILPVLDNLERALESAPPDDPFVEGVALIHRQLRESLGKAGLEPIRAVGEPFNPLYHEAVSAEENAEFESNRVLAQIQTGYLFRGRVLRPSMVKVSVAPEGEGAEPGISPAGNDEPES